MARGVGVGEMLAICFLEGTGCSRIKQAQVCREQGCELVLEG